MGRPGITYETFTSVADAYVEAGTPAAKVTLKMLAEKLAASNSSLVKFKRKWISTQPQIKQQIREMPIDIAASIEAYADRRVHATREDLGEQLQQAEATELALLAEANDLAEELEALRKESRVLATDMIVLDAQNKRQSSEITELKSNLESATDRASATTHALHAAQGDAQAAIGRMDELRVSTDRQLTKLYAELELARVAHAAVEQRAMEADRRAADSEMRAVAAEAHLEGERKAKGALEAQVSALQGDVKPAQADAARAAAAEASNVGLHAQISLLNLTIATFRELLKDAGHGKEAGDGTGRSSAPLRMGAVEASAVD